MVYNSSLITADGKVARGRGVETEKIITFVDITSSHEVTVSTVHAVMQVNKCLTS